MTQAAQLAQYGANNVGLSFKNRIINGDMTIDQRRAGASFSNLVSNEYTLDRWSCYGNVAGRFSIQRSTSSVTGFTNSLLVTSLASTTPGSTDIYILRQYIEGFNTADLAWGTSSAQPITVSFWVQSSLTGTFGGVIKNGVENRGYPFTYTINAANTNEYKTITIPGDTTGAWATDSNCGIQLLFSLGAGSGAVTSPGAWTAGNIWAPTGQSNIVGTNGATWRITGVQLEKGSVATSFDYLPYGTELMLCQRYFELVSARFGGAAQSSAAASGTGIFVVEKRATPTITWISSTASLNFPTTAPAGYSPVINTRYFTPFKIANGTSYDSRFDDLYSASAEL